MAKLEISVAIIFKNEIRCLERCLKSLQPLRERFSAEVVMADTGSTDGSRAIAAKYADVLFDFPWINDFSAARNAVLERCSGAWALVIDCDEWLEPRLEELEAVIRGDAADGCDGASLIVRNYYTEDLDFYNDFPGFRLLRMANGIRYAGAIHEACFIEGHVLSVYYATDTILHHDGYIMLNDNSEIGRAKSARNVALLREELRREPKNPLRHLQMIESGHREPDYQSMLKSAIALKSYISEENWQKYGPIYYRAALTEAREKNLPEWEQWWEESLADFPRSYYTRVDGNYVAALHAMDLKRYEDVIERGEAYLRALSEFRADPFRMVRTSVSSLSSSAERLQTWLLIQLAEAFLNLGQAEQAVLRLQQIPWYSMDALEIERALSLLLWCFFESAPGWEEVLRGFWRGITQDQPNPTLAGKRIAAFLGTGRRIFQSGSIYNQSLGKAMDSDGHPPRDLFLPLAGICVLGDAAALLRCDGAEEADAILTRVENLRELPASALIHALKLGAEFPLPGRTLTTDDMDALALGVSEDAAFSRDAAVSAAFSAETVQDILWARSLTLAALRSFDGAAEEERWPLVCAFARVQSLFLPLCYGGGALLREEYLPSLYRFGLHLAKAVAVLEPSLLNPGFVSKTRDARDAVAELRLALRAAPEYNAVVSCVLDRL